MMKCKGVMSGGGCDSLHPARLLGHTSRRPVDGLETVV